MKLTGSDLWDKHALKNGYVVKDGLETDDNATTSANICNDFFAQWPSDCVDKNKDLHEKLRVLSAQMVAMDSKLTLFVTDMKGCSFPYKNILVEKFNQTDLLIETGFEPAFPKMDTWVKTRYTRISDILRLGLAYKYKMSYIDTDITFLELKKQLYMKQYVGAALWSNKKNAIEITNGAFCLPQNILKDMMSYQKERIVNGDDTYFYTELGPSTFHNVLMNRHAVVLYSQNAPAERSLDEIARTVHKYGHKQLHLTGHVRKGNPELKFSEIVNTIRKKCGIPQLHYEP
jgi:hypothetical protein